MVAVEAHSELLPTPLIPVVLAALQAAAQLTSQVEAAAHPSDSGQEILHRAAAQLVFTVLVTLLVQPITQTAPQTVLLGVLV
jgi:hypothetical protein